MQDELKAYSVFDSEHESGCVCFAHSSSGARSLAYGSEALDGVEYTDLRARRLKAGDKYASRFGSGVLGFEIENDRIYRELGWWGVDSSLQCVWCELHEFDSIAESKVTETEDGDMICQECLEQEKQERENLKHARTRKE